MTDEGAFLDDHSRTIIHIDIDCFYAQVEMIKNPNLKTVPFAVHQKNYLVTSNHVAREFGLKKMILISEAKKLCPNLILINGEDLHDYRHTSYKVTELLTKSYELVERLALDENFIDVSKQVASRLKNYQILNIVGNVFGDNNDACDCGCNERLKIGTVIAQELRDQIKSELNLTTCAGIAHNKLLAKIVGSTHRPDQQTVVFPNDAVELMLSQQSISKITGIGPKLSEQLSTLEIHTIEDLQRANLSKVSLMLGADKAKYIYDLSYGLDRAPVKTSGKPQSIGIEDCKPISIEKEVIEKLQELLKRLLILVTEDGRIPRTIKLTVRQIDKITKIGNRKTRQCDINTSLFNSNDLTKLSDATFTKIMSVVMQLLNKLVDTKKPFHLTLLGISFTKFFEKPNTNNSLTKYLGHLDVPPVSTVENSTNVKNISKKLPSSFVQSTDFEPSTKKCNLQNDPLNPEKNFQLPQNHNFPSKSETDIKYKSQKICCPLGVDEEVFRQLPKYLQEELWNEYEEKKENPYTSKVKKKSNSILNYLVRR